MTKSSQPESRKPREHVLVIAEHQVDLAARMAELDRAGARIERLVQRETELPGDFMRRLADALQTTEQVYDRTIFVAREPIGPRLNELVRTIVSSMRPGTRLIMAAEHPTPSSTRALSALALTVMELAFGADVIVEGAAKERSPARAWRRRIDRALDSLLTPPVSARRAS